MSKAISLTGLSEFLKKCKELFAEKEEKYIIIDWEGKDSNDATKKAEVDAQLKNIYLANPLALFSVVFVNYGEYNLTSSTGLGHMKNDDVVTISILSDETLAEELYHFSIS